jgi:putative endonuclease
VGKLSKDLGNLGESIAVRHLSEIGYKVLERNFRSNQGEIDIIAEDGEVLSFVEVKNYSFRSYGTPLGAVRKSKRENIIHAARTYLYKKNIKDKSCRFDVLSIYWESRGERKIELIKDAFRIN